MIDDYCVIIDEYYVMSDDYDVMTDDYDYDVMIVVASDASTTCSW
jgi:hypothetical protein